MSALGRNFIYQAPATFAFSTRGGEGKKEKRKMGTGSKKIEKIRKMRRKPQRQSWVGEMCPQLPTGEKGRAPRPGHVLMAPQGTRSIKENENAPPEGGEFKNTPDSSRVYVALRKS